MTLIPFHYGGINILIRDGISVNAERDIVREVMREYPWDMPIRSALDIGAHIGAWSLYCKHLCPDARIVACEVDPDTYTVLETNTHSLSDVIRVHGRAGYGTGQYALLRAPNNTGSTMAYPMMPYETVLTREMPNGDVAYTPVLAPGRVTLEDLILLGGFERVDVMKIDCEGAEIDLLTHAETDTLMRIDRVIGEIHTIPDEFEAQTDYRLQRVGFHVTYRPHPGDPTLFYLDARRSVMDENLHMQTYDPIAPDDDTPLPQIPPYEG